MSKEISSRSEKNERTRLLKARLDQWEIKVVCWDLDDTLIATRRTFLEAMTEASALLVFGRQNGLDEQEQEEALLVRERKMIPMVIGLRDEFSVRPEIMEITVILTARQLGLDPEENRAVLARQRVRDLYRVDRPSCFSGSLGTVDQFNATGIRSVLTSHAEKDWIEKKLLSAGLFDKFDSIIAFSIDQRKSSQWQDKFSQLGVNPENILVLGDNPEEDIVPTASLGARTIWVNSYSRRRKHSSEFDWDSYGDRIIEVSAIGQVVDRIISA